MKLVCATLLAFVLVTPAAHAGPQKKPRDTTPPTVPTNVRVVARTDDSVTIRWNASTDNSGTILRYQVNGVYHPGNSTEKTISFLVPNYTFTVRVQAVDPTENYSALSEPLQATTAPDVIAPTNPANLRLTSTVSPSSITLGWDRSTDRWSFSYDIFDVDRGFIASASSISTRLRHLTPGATYNLRVRARDNAGNVSGFSNTLPVTMPASGDTAAPTRPSNLAAEDLNDFCGSVILRWGQSTDNVDPQSALEYEIYRNGLFFSLVTGTGTAGVYAGDGTSTWTVKAVDRSGNTSAASNSATVTVVEDPNQC